MLHLWSPLHSLGTFLAPLVYLPWKTNECYLKAYSLIDFAITLPDGLGVMIDFEVAGLSFNPLIMSLAAFII